MKKKPLHDLERAILELKTENKMNLKGITLEGNPISEGGINCIKDDELSQEIKEDFSSKTSHKNIKPQKPQIRYSSPKPRRSKVMTVNKCQYLEDTNKKSIEAGIKAGFQLIKSENISWTEKAIIAMICNPTPVTAKQLENIMLGYCPDLKPNYTYSLVSRISEGAVGKKVCSITRDNTAPNKARLFNIPQIFALVFMESTLTFTRFFNGNDISKHVTNKKNFGIVKEYMSAYTPTRIEVEKKVEKKTPDDIPSTPKTVPETVPETNRGLMIDKDMSVEVNINIKFPQLEEIMNMFKAFLNQT